MCQPGEDSVVALQKITALENKWTASKARLSNIISCIGTSVPSLSAASCILEQLDQAQKNMVSVFDEMSAMLAPTKQDELIEDFNKQEKIYNEAKSRLSNVKNERITIRFDTGVPDEVKEKYLRQSSGNTADVEWDAYFRGYKNNIASDAALELLKMKKMPLSLLLERFRRSIFLLSFTGHHRDWEFLLLLIIRECLNIEEKLKGAHEEELRKVICSLADPEEE